MMIKNNKRKNIQQESWDRKYLKIEILMQNSLASIQMRIEKQDNLQNPFNQLKFKVGQLPHYISPKITQSTTQPQIVSQSQFNSSVIVPKFHSPSMVQSVGMTTKPLKNKKDQVLEQFTELLHPKDLPPSTLFTLINFLIWLFYIIGSIDFSNETLSGYHILDIIANSLALILLSFTIYTKRQISSLSQVLHIWSIALTITFLLYPLKTSTSPQSDRIFIQVLNIFRSLRLIFPIFIRQSPISLSKKMLQVIFNSKKIISFVMIICFLLGFFCYQTFSGSSTNRCRIAQTPYALNTWDPVDQRLCGQRNCPKGSYCRNLNLFIQNQKLNENSPKNLQSGIFSFDSSWKSAFSVFQMFTLNEWGRISQIYFDVYPAWISVPFYIIGWIMFEKLIMALIVLFYDAMKQKREKLHLLTLGQRRKPSQNNLIAQEDIKVQAQDVTISRVNSDRSLFAQKDGSQGPCQSNNQEMSLAKKLVLYTFATTYSISHIVLVSQFGLNPSKIDDDLYNRRIGVVLSVFFILHIIGLGCAKTELNQSTEETSSNDDVIQTSMLYPEKHQYGMTQNQVIQTVLSLESFIFYVSLTDYFLRLIQGKYILQERSGLTALTHFAICLRLYYVYLAVIDIFKLTSLQSHLMTCIKTLKSMLRFLTMIIATAITLGAMSFYINQNNYQKSQRSMGMLFEINRFLMFLINHSWQSLHKFPITQGTGTEESSFVSIAGGICLVIGSMIFLRFTISHLVHESFWQSLNGKEKCSEQEYIEEKKKTQQQMQQNVKQVKVEQVVQQDQETVLKREKSLFIFGFDNCIRQLAYDIVKSDSYLNVIRFRFFLVYIITNIISCIACNSKIYGIISTVLQIFVLIDIILSAIALRFTGKFSYSENKFANIMHFFLTFIVIAFGLTQFQVQFIPFIQITRILLVLNCYDSFKQTFIFIESIYKAVLLHFLILIPIILGHAFMMLLMLSSKNQNDPFMVKMVEAFKFSLIIFTQKGWDLDRFIGNQVLSSEFGQLALFSIILTWISLCLSFCYSLAGIMIALLIKLKQSSDEDVKKELFNQNFLLEEHKIKQRISKIKPKFNANIYASGCLLQICQSNIFRIVKKICCIGSILCFLVLNNDLNTDGRIIVYTVHLFFFTSEIILFAFETIVYNKNQDHFTRDLLLTLFAIPGAYIGFANPVHFSSGSTDLKVILIFFNALTVIRFIKIINYFTALQSIYTFLRQKMTRTFNTFACLMVFTASTGFYLYLIFQKQQPIIDCLNYSFIGLAGGDFDKTVVSLIERNAISFTYEIHLLYFTVNLLSISFKNLLLAFIIYELSDYARQRMPITSVELNLFNFNKYFHENKFIEEWMKIDPQGKGFVNYSTIMHKSHKFIVTFSVTSIPYKPYINRIQTFRKLQIPIYEAETTYERQENQKPQIRKEYVVTFYDFLFQMAKFTFKQMSSNKLMSKGQYYIKNITFTDQPVSIINIGEGQNHKLSNFSKKGSKQDSKQDKKLQEIKEQWKKRCYDLTKENMAQKREEHEEASQLNAVLRPTKFTSQELYFAHRVKNKVYKFLRKVQISNQMKRFEEIHKFKQRLNV